MLKRIVSGIMLLLLLGMIISLVPVYATETKVSVVPTCVTASPGETFTVNITVNNVSNLYAWQIVIEYNNTVLNSTDAWLPEDNVFKDKNHVTPEPYLYDFETYAFVVYGSCLFNETVVDVPEVGILCSLNFTVLEKGHSFLRIATKDDPALPPGAWMMPDGTWHPYEFHTMLLDIYVNEMAFIEESGAVVAGGPSTTITITTTDGGTTDPAPSKYTYLTNITVSVTAIPELGFELSCWELDGSSVGLDNPYSVAMDTNHILHAVFVVHEPVTWTVDDDGPADFHAIQEAINSPNVTYGDMIFVYPGIYREHVNLNKSVQLVGSNKELTIIDGNGTGTVVWLNTRCNITGFTIKNGEYGIRVSGHHTTPSFTGHRIEDNRVLNNHYGAISLRNCANNTISNNIIENNTLFGIHLWGADNNTLINNTIVNNGHGIDFYGGSDGNILRNNSMTDNKYNFGVILRGETMCWLSGLSRMVNDVDTSNTVDGKPVYCWVNRHDEQVPSDAGYVWLTDCSNITVKGLNLSNNLQGILLLLNTNNTLIVNNNITSNAYGVYVGIYSSNNTIIGNQLQDNLNGIYLGEFSKFTTMRNNKISGGQMNFGLSPDIPRLMDRSDLINDVDTSNTVDGKPIVYWINQHDRKVPTNTGYVMLINSTNILIEDLNLSNNVQSILVLESNNTVIANNSITNSIYGIDVRGVGYALNFSTWIYHASFNTTVRENVLVDNGVGMRLRSDSSSISNNMIIRNPLGIYLTRTSNSTISRNTVVASDINTTYPGSELFMFYYPEWPWERSMELTQMQIGGIIVGGAYNIVCGNTVMDSCPGISMNDRIRANIGTGNVIFHNNFINNSPYQALKAVMGHNHWDNGYPSGGNYWSDYNGLDLYSGPYQNETGSDGVGDTSHIILFPSYGKLTDGYPLMAPISIFDVGSWNRVNRDISIISNSTISDFQLNRTQKIVSFTVTGETGLGFYRVTIPNVIVQDFWQNNYTILVNGQLEESRNWTDGDNTYIYFTYQHSTQKVTIIPESSSNIVLALLMTFSLIIFILAKRKFAKLRNSTDFEV